jgi:tetratricopeptide (TPR) repeat protein
MHATQMRPFFVLALLALLPACRGGAPKETQQAVSLQGVPLHAQELEPERRAELEAHLAEARARLAAEPDSEEAAIWVGRRLSYLGRYREAVEVYTRALEQHPESVKLLRHRGHRFITLREFDRAMDDLTRAALRMYSRPDEPEPDGQPNAAGVPRSSTYTNVHYHLALVHYLQGAYALAADNWRRCREHADNDDMIVAADYWLFLALMRMGLEEEAEQVLAEIHPRMDVLENHDYHRLLLHFAGDLSERELLLPLERGTLSYASTNYGLGAWRLVLGDRERARALFERVIGQSFWPAFGHIAAEVELARMGR